RDRRTGRDDATSLRSAAAPRRRAAPRAARRAARRGAGIRPARTSLRGRARVPSRGGGVPAAEACGDNRWAARPAEDVEFAAEQIDAGRHSVETECVAADGCRVEAGAVVL